LSFSSSLGCCTQWKHVPCISNFHIYLPALKFIQRLAFAKQFCTFQLQKLIDTGHDIIIYFKKMIKCNLMC
jgi:hypothetical protein